MSSHLWLKVQAIVGFVTREAIRGMGQIFNFPERGSMKAIENPRPAKSVKEILIKNVAYFYKKQWTQPEPQGKTICNITNGTNATVPSLELVSDRARIPVWYLFLPLSEPQITSKTLENLVYKFINLDEEGQELVLKVAQTASRKK